ncbi:hypothetical protein FKM82_027881 [Ascaphus truei]
MCHLHAYSPRSGTTGTDHANTRRHACTVQSKACISAHTCAGPEMRMHVCVVPSVNQDKHYIYSRQKVTRVLICMSFPRIPCCSGSTVL